MQHGIVVGKTVFGYWQRTAHRHQLPIATAACALVMTTGKGQMFSVEYIEICAQIFFNAEIHRMPLRGRKSVTHRTIAEVSKGAAALREACAAEPAFQSGDNLRNGVKQNDLAAQLVFTFAQRLRFNETTPHGLPAAKRQEDKHWVRILRPEGSTTQTGM